MNAEAPSLIVTTDGNKRCPLQDPTTLGRLSENDLPLDDAGCSNRHAVIRKEDGLPLGNTTPPPTVVMTPLALETKVPPPFPQAMPPPLPPSTPPLPIPVRKKKGGCWLSCCLVSLVLLLFAGVAAWFLWNRLIG